MSRPETAFFALSLVFGRTTVWNMNYSGDVMQWSRPPSPSGHCTVAAPSWRGVNVPRGRSGLSACWPLLTSSRTAEGAHDFRPPPYTVPSHTESVQSGTTGSSLVEAGTVDHLREQPQRFHRIHRLFHPLWCQRWLVGDVVSDMHGLLQCTYPREELREGRRVPVPTRQPLPVAAQTQQGSVFDGHVDVVAIGLDLLSERAFVPAEDKLDRQRFAR